MKGTQSMINFDRTVVCKNEINTVALTDFTPMEIDLLFAILSKVKNKGESRIVCSFKDLKQIVHYTKSNAIEVFAKQLDSTYKKLLSLNIKIGDDRHWTRFVLFTEYDIFLDKQIVSIKVNEKFIFLVNRIVGNFTKFELKEFSLLSSTYSKNMYRLLKQWRSTGFAVYTIEEFRRLLDIPDSYSMGNINQRIIPVIQKDLKPYFKNLKIKKIKGKGKNSRKIVRLEFKFKPEEVKSTNDVNDIDYDREYTKSELLEFPIDIANKAKPVFGIYREDLDLIGIYEKDGSFTVFANQDELKWKLEKEDVVPQIN